MKITQKREGDKINFYDDDNTCCVATLLDGHSDIIYDELAYRPALLDEVPGVEEAFRGMGLGPEVARLLDGHSDIIYDELAYGPAWRKGRIRVFA